jgi:hypothetical protein
MILNNCCCSQIQLIKNPYDILSRQGRLTPSCIERNWNNKMVLRCICKCMLLGVMPWISLVTVKNLNPMTQNFCVGYSILLGRMHLLQFARMNESE